MLGRSRLLTSARLRAGGGARAPLPAARRLPGRPLPAGPCAASCSLRLLGRRRGLSAAPRPVAAWRESRGTPRSLAASRLPPPPRARARPDPAAVDPGGLVAGAQRFRFWGEPGSGADGVVLEVRVPQVLHLQYGMYAWPCAVVLAQYLWFHRNCLPEKAVLEIGAGVSLPGILAAKCGAKVILSDSAELPHCLEMCRQSCQLNNLPQVQVVGLTWGHISQDLLSLPPQDIILASDVFFEPEDFEDILVTVYFLMQKNPKVQLWSTYQVRSADWSLEALLYKWDMKCIHIPLETFEADKEDLAESSLPGRHTVEMLIIFAKGSL